MSQDVETETARLEKLRRIKAQAQVAGGQVTVPRDLMADLFAAAFADVVDEDWYLDRYPDVADAVSRGVVESASVHYRLIGIYEGRMPYRVRLDNADYLERHSDVLTSIRDGAFRSALDHFIQVGFGEGRPFRLASTESSEA